MHEFQGPPSRILISLSGGRTSAYMAIRMLENAKEADVFTIVFANTGQEHEATLEFMWHLTAYIWERFGVAVVWVEAVTHLGERIGATHKVIDYEAASRDGQPFRDMCAKYGLPNSAYPHCTRELKLNPIRSYMRFIGWSAGSYRTAVGIRSDEIDRMSSAASKNRIIYPLIKWKIKKADVLTFWRRQQFDLTIPEHQGNCVWCWKKSYNKLSQVYLDNPAAFDFPKMLEATYANEKSSTMFRQRNSALDIERMAQSGEFGYNDPNYDTECGGGCGAFG